MQLNVWKNYYKNISGSSLLSHVCGQGTKTLECEVIDLFCYCQDKNIIADLIKLDLQGFELEALNMYKSLLRQVEIFILDFGC